jgi:type IV pilus assembly protein PilY1
MSLHGCVRKILSKSALACIVGFLSLGMAHSVMSVTPSQVPLFLTAPVKPLMMLNMSNDHQLFFKAYDDYSDITGPEGGEPDGSADTTYIHKYNYYGYFDSKKCYTYQNNRFEPAVMAGGDKYCNGSHWSGNFLNWATMTRIDAVRKILYGGLRQVDTATETVLERAFLPNDAHSFAKYYNGADVGGLTPFDNVTTGNASSAGLTICNTTNPANRSQYSQTVTDPPHMLVAKGNYSLWASNERWQCRWGTASNGNNSAVTGINAHSSSPSFNTNRLGNGDYNVRVKVCDAGFTDNENENCKSYGASQKPTGLLQEFGESGSIAFGLFTGSYGKNKSGGVLRKNIGVMTDEIKADGTFKLPTNGEGIINTLDLLRIFGYDFVDGIYEKTGASGDNCPFGLSGFSDGRCTNWGNPQAEIYLESLRYFAGKQKMAAFDTNDSSKIAGLKTAAWVDPLSSANYCAPMSVIQFNASTTSYDADVAAGEADFPNLNIINETNAVGVLEELSGEYFVGANGIDNNELCTAKTVSDLASVRGTCPDAPRLKGSYLIAGLAKYARTNDIRPALTDAQKVRTYGVALSPAVPAVTVSVPGSNGAKQVKILPACQNTQTSTTVDGVANSAPQREGNCAIVDFKIIEATNDSDTQNSGKLYVNWEAAEQGGDFDQDMWGIINYTVTSSLVTVTTNVIQQSTGRPLGFGYIISGTENDGFKVHSGVNNYRDNASCSISGSCTCHSGTGTQTCNLSGASAQTYIVGTSSANSLETPLYYAAKWGGYSNELIKEAEKAIQPVENLVKIREPSDSYFFATDPRNLERSLRAAFQGVAAEVGTAASAATNSTRLNDGTRFYQAMFNSENWTGTLKALQRNAAGDVVDIIGVSTDTHFDTGNSIDTGRNVLIKQGSELVPFEWSNLDDWQKEQLAEVDEGTEVDEVLVTDRINWIRGSRAKEGAAGGMRVRAKLLGDIVNSNPVFSGNKSNRYSYLPGEAGTSYKDYEKGRALFVGANDGMLHAFNMETFAEIFAYIPREVFPKLANLTKPDYGRGANQHKYLVDGPLYVGDAYLGAAADGTDGTWKTILIGSYGGGAKGVFALDVTDPAAPEILFELGSEQYPELGYVMGEALITPLKNGRWAAVFGNGYDAGTSQLFVVDLDAPLDSNYTKVIDTGGGTGLSGPALLPNAFSQTEYAYAGDLQGNVWKFDLSSSNPSEWGVAYDAPLFIAKDNSGNAQPITGSMTLGLNAQRNYNIMVYFGTGKYFENLDNLAPTYPRHSFYAIADGGEPLEYSSRNDILHRKSFTQDATGKRTILGEKNEVAGVVTSDVNWQQKKGWYLDFNIVNGERIITKPVLIMDRLIFNTVKPSAIACDYGGESWMMELIGIGDKQLQHSVLGDNANTPLGSLVVSDPTILIGAEGGVKFDCNVAGDCTALEIVPWDNYNGRINWRVLR